MIQRVKRLLCFLFFLILSLHPLAYSAQNWQIIKGDHFIINFTKDKKFAQEVLSKSDEYYRKIAENFGFSRYSNFWTWENRARIFIYPDHSSYIEATGQPQWSDGVADYKNKQISTYNGNEKFSVTILPHEIAHLIFRDFVGFIGDIPAWLDEGVAQSADEEDYEKAKTKAVELYEKSSLITLSDLTSIDIKEKAKFTSVFDIRMKDNDPGILILNPEQMLMVYYVESASIVGFLRERYGPNRFKDFCSELREGKTVEEALRKAYPVDCPNIKALEQKWRQYLSEQEKTSKEKEEEKEGEDE